MRAAVLLAVVTLITASASALPTPPPSAQAVAETTISAHDTPAAPLAKRQFGIWGPLGGPGALSWIKGNACRRLRRRRTSEEEAAAVAHANADEASFAEHGVPAATSDDGEGRLAKRQWGGGWWSGGDGAGLRGWPWFGGSQSSAMYGSTFC